MLLTRYVASGIAMTLATGSLTPAAVVFDGGPGDVTNGQALFWDMADDFEVSSDAQINGATVPIIAILGGLNLATWDGSIRWTVYAAGPALVNPNGSVLSATTPGAVIAQGTGSNIETTFRSQSPGPFGDLYQYYSFDFDFGQDISIQANTRYWFGLHLNQSYTQAYLYWQQTNTHLLDHNFGRPNPQSNYGYQGSWVGFQLNYNIPEPASAAFLAMPAAVLRRRRASTKPGRDRASAKRFSPAFLLVAAAAALLAVAAPKATAAVVAQAGFESSEGYSAGTQLATYAPPWSGSGSGWTISNNTIGGSGARSGSQWVLVDANDGQPKALKSPIANTASEPILTVSTSMKVVSPVSGAAERGVFMGMNLTDNTDDGYTEIDLIYDAQNFYGFGTNRWLVQQIFADFNFHLTDLGTTPLFDTYLDLAIRTDMSTGNTTMLVNGTPLPHTGPSLLSNYLQLTTTFFFQSTISGGGGVRARGGIDDFSVVQSVVPEPATVGVLAAMVAGSVRRRR